MTMLNKILKIEFEKGGTGKKSKTEMLDLQLFLVELFSIYEVSFISLG